MARYKAEDLNYKTTCKCDDCGTEAHGTMIHCTTVGCPILFICDSCANPTLAKRASDAVKRFVVRTKLKWNWYKKPRAERKAIRAKKAEFRARVAAIKARRVEQ